MTVLTDTIKNDYVGDGAQTDFNYTFKVFTESEMSVFIDGVEISSSLWSMTGLGEDAGGVVTIPIAPADGQDVSLRRAMEYKQLIDYQAYDKFPSETHERALDRIVMMVLQIASAAIGGEEPGTVIPAYAAGEYIRWDTTLRQLVTGTPVASSLNPATDGEVTAGTGTTPLAYTPAQLKLATETHTPYTIENVAALPGTPDPNTIYLVDE